ncbi:MAG TPA: hypothetical protein VKF36_18410 [Syntrophorhabdales bacterium]|nr:hypothetical protein [Syntrophorhabdales bacterium]
MEGAKEKGQRDVKIGEDGIRFARKARSVMEARETTRPEGGGKKEKKALK